MSDVQALASVFGPRFNALDTDELRQRNVRIRSYTDSVLQNLARSADLPFQTLVNLVLSAGLEALEAQLGTEAFERAALFEYDVKPDGSESKGPVVPDSVRVSREEAA